MKKNLKRCYISIWVFLIVFIFFTPIIVKAEEEDINFKRINIEDGLSQASVESIFQDNYGYMWFGTEDGLNRYDGHNFDVFKYEGSKKNNINGIISNIVSDVLQDKDGDLLIATSKGLSKIDNKTGKIVSYTYDEKNNNSLSHYNIWDIFIDSKNRIWVGTENGLNIFFKEKGTFKRIYIKETNLNGDPNNFVTSIEEDGKGNIWVGTKDGLEKYDEKNNKFLRVDLGNLNNINLQYVSKIYKDKNNHLWIGTKDNGLFELDEEGNKINRFQKEEENPFGIPSNTIRAVYEDEIGNIWIGTDRGLAKYLGNNKFITYKNSLYNPQSLTNDQINTIFEDKSGIVWVGTNNGISTFNPKTIFKHYKRTQGKNSFSDNMIQGIYEDKDGELWIGTNSGGLNRFNRKNNNIKIYKHDEDQNSISDDTVWTVTGKDDEIWIATSYGLNKLNKKTNTFTNYYNDGTDKSLIWNEVKSLYIDREGILWIGTRNGLCTFDRKDSFKSYNFIFDNNGIIDKFITSIYEDDSGVMWFGSAINGGVTSYNKSTGQVKNYKSEESDDSLSINSIKAITGDKLGNLWIATNYGLNKFDRKTKGFSRYTEKLGLANNFVYGVLIDNEGNPWVSTNGGICKLDIVKNKFISFNITDGLQNNEFNAYSFHKSKSGEMFFGGINGFNSFYPGKLQEETFLPKVVIKDFLISGNHKDIRENIILNYNQNFFSFEFFLPDYRNVTKTNYAYKLDGVDKSWIYSNNRNYANYTNVRPGKYRFLVKARNATGEWSDPTVIDVMIKNPPWQTPMAYTLYIIIIIIIVIFIWNRMNILEGLVRQRTLELNNKLDENEELYNKLIKIERYKNNYFVNLSHELRTPLNVILATVQLINEFNSKGKKITKDKLAYYMDALKGNSDRLLRLINNIIDTSKIESGTYRLHITEVDIVYLVEEVALSMKNYIESKGIELIIDPEIEEKAIECDRGEIERCVVNLIGNAVKFTKEGGTIEVVIKDNIDTVDIIVRDTGIGIDEKYHKAIFNRFGQAYNSITEEHGGSGLGLTLVNQLVKLHKGDIKLKSKLGEGSEFTITIPVKQNIDNNDID